LVDWTDRTLATEGYLVFKAFFLVLCFPMPVGHTPTKPPASTTYEILGLTAIVGPAKVGLSLGGIGATSTIDVAGGSGTMEAKSGILGPSTVHILVKDAKVEELVKGIGGDLPAWLKPKLVGRIGQVVIDVKGDDVAVTATSFRIPGDPVSRIEVKANLKTRGYKAKLYALGGLAEAEGTLPESK
jgi:hypothetical protein